MTAESTPFVSLITGAASGLGWEITQRLYSRGDTVVLVDMNAELLATRSASWERPSGSSPVAATSRRPRFVVTSSRSSSGRPGAWTA